jgi:uncharacterized protein YuzE
MKITYDHQADVLFIEITKKQPVDSIDIEDGIHYEIDAEGHIVNLEILSASTVCEDPSTIDFEQYLIPKRKLQTTRS